MKSFILSIVLLFVVVSGASATELENMVTAVFSQCVAVAVAPRIFTCEDAKDAVYGAFQDCRSEAEFLEGGLFDSKWTRKEIDSYYIAVYREFVKAVADVRADEKVCQY